MIGFYGTDAMIEKAGDDAGESQPDLTPHSFASLAEKDAVIAKAEELLQKAFGGAL